MKIKQKNQFYVQHYTDAKIKMIRKLQTNFSHEQRSKNAQLRISELNPCQKAIKHDNQVSFVSGRYGLPQQPKIKQCNTSWYIIIQQSNSSNSVTHCIMEKNIINRWRNSFDKSEKVFSRQKALRKVRMEGNWTKLIKHENTPFLKVKD